VQRGYPVSGKEVDIALFLHSGPFIFVETKRKQASGSSKLYASLDSAVIGQAIGYCALQEDVNGQKVPYFITITPKNFGVPHPTEYFGN
jgi:hypothetical protein